MEFTAAWLMWLIMGIICFVLEMILPGFVIFFFGVGSWITALLCWLYPAPVNMQLAVFLVSSTVSLFIFRRFVRNVFIGDDSSEDKDVIESAGEQATVTETIDPPAEGKINFSGTTWRATADHKIEKDSVVTILSQDGLCMKVSKEVEQK